MMRLLRGGTWLVCGIVPSALWLSAAGGGPAAATPTNAPVSVGMPAKIDQLVLPGSELEVKPLEDRRTPFVLRIREVYPHGSAFRYDLTYYALEPGGYDLRDYLRRKDGSALGDLPPVLVEVVPILPPGQVEPTPLELSPSPWLGGYRLLLAVGGSLWCAGLAAILLLGRRRSDDSASQAGKPETLADRLRPLVNRAVAGTLSPGEHAELERLLIGYWRNRLALQQTSPAEAMATLRQHAEAGPLLRKLEEWLHQPPADRSGSIDVADLLRPYQSLPADEAEAAQSAAPRAVPASMPGAPR